MPNKQTRRGQAGTPPSPSRPSPRAGRPAASFPAALLLLFAGALVVRLVYVLEMRANSPFWDHPFLDARYYLEWAQGILSGRHGVEGVFVRAPGYPCFLALVGAVFQLHHGTIAAAQAILGSASCVLVALIGRRVWGDRIGLAAGVVAAAHGALVYWAGEILIETLFIFLLLLMVEFTLRANAAQTEQKAERAAPAGAAGAQKTNPPATAPRTPMLWWGAAGAAAGLAAITRPTGLPLLLVPPLSAFLAAGPLRSMFARHGTAGMALLRTPRWRAAALALGIALAIVGVVTVRNFVVGGDFVPVASHGGINFWTGNNARADGKIVVIPENIQLPPEMRDQDNIIALATVGAEKELGRKLRPSEVSAFWVRQALDWMAADPLRAAALQLRKLYYFWAGCEYTNNEDVYGFRRYSRLLSVLLLPLGPVYLPGALIMPLSLYGFWIRRREFRRWMAVYATVAIYMVTVVAFFVSSRHRLPVVPLCLPFALGGAVGIARGRAWREGVPGRIELAAAVGLILFLGINLDARPEATRTKFAIIAANTWTQRAEEAEAAGLADRAVVFYDRALAERPDDPAVHYKLALLHGRSGRFRESEAHLRRTLAATPDDPVVLINLALTCAYQGRKPEARQLLERARALGGRVDPQLEAIVSRP